MKGLFLLVLLAVLTACGGESVSSGSSPSSAPALNPDPTPELVPAGPNVIFIVADDLNDYIDGMGGHPQAYTPNLKRLADRGVMFTNAHANAPLCTSSRASFLSGYLPSTSGKYHATRHFREHPVLSTAKLLPEQFRDNGFAVYGGGKIFHGQERENTVYGTSDPDTQPAGANDRSGGYMGPDFNFGPFPWDGLTIRKSFQSVEIAYGDEGIEWTRGKWDRIELLPGGRWNSNPDLPLAIQQWVYGHGRLSQPPVFLADMNGAYPSGHSYSGWGDFEYEGPSNRSLLSDEKVGDWVAGLITGSAANGAAPIDQRQFFIAAGLVKTHVAKYIPDEFFDEVIQANGIKSIDDVALPPLYEQMMQNDDLLDVPEVARLGAGFKRFNDVMTAGLEGGTIPDLVNPGDVVANTPERLLKSLTLSYLAAVYVIDVQVGKILDALDTNPAIRSSTTIVFTSDHGWHNGEKNAYGKYTLWNETTRVPLIIVSPSVEFDDSRGTVSDHPVSLVDIYPPLIELTEIPGPPIADGSPPHDGQSLVPILRDTINAELSPEPAAMTSGWARTSDDISSGPLDRSHTIRTRHWRYTLNKGGGEELYDQEMDQNEWYNIVTDPNLLETKKDLKQVLLDILDQP